MTSYGGAATSAALPGARGRPSAEAGAEVDRRPEPEEEAEHLGHPPEEVDARRPPLGEVDRDLAGADAGPLRPDHQLGGEDVEVDDALVDDRQEDVAAQRLEAVGVGAVEAEGEAEEAQLAEDGDTGSGGGT